MKRTAQILKDHLLRKCLKLALAESVTCGLAASELATVSKTSDFFMGSLVCYNENLKTKLLGINKKLIKKYSAESEQVTKDMVKNLKRLVQADVYASITGLAAPGGSETQSKPVGTIFISVLFKGKYYSVRKILRGSPLIIRKKACKEMFKLIAEIVH